MADERHERPSLRGIARRILREVESTPGEETEVDPEERRRRIEDVLSSVLETGDKAKTEMVRMVAREVRGYLDALELHKDVHHLLTHYSLEVKASIHLAPLGEKEAQAGSSAKVGLERRPRAGASTEGEPGEEG